MSWWRKLLGIEKYQPTLPPQAKREPVTRVVPTQGWVDPVPASEPPTPAVLDVSPAKKKPKAKAPKVSGSTKRKPVKPTARNTKVARRTKNVE